MALIVFYVALLRDDENMKDLFAYCIPSQRKKRLNTFPYFTVLGHIISIYRNTVLYSGVLRPVCSISQTSIAYGYNFPLLSTRGKLDTQGSCTRNIIPSHHWHQLIYLFTLYKTHSVSMFSATNY